MSTASIFPPSPTYHTLRLILGDQLDIQHSWFAHGPQPGVLYLMAEPLAEHTYVRHHIQKQLMFLAAMEAFAKALLARGFALRYVALDEPADHPAALHQTQRRDFPTIVQAVIAQFDIQRFEYQEPDEYRLDEALRVLAQTLPVASEFIPSEHFLTQRMELAQQFGDRPHWVMEQFYRRIRTRTGILMDAHGKPAGGAWNYDHQNRGVPPRGYQPPPQPWVSGTDFGPARQRLRAAGLAGFGLDADNATPVTRTQALDWLQYFVAHHLPQFGQYQDAMLSREPFLHHSLLSFALNVKLLRPREVVEAAVLAWQTAPERYPLASVEGFVRQVIGWREYMRGVYWAKMPDYAQTNYLGAETPLPSWYWTGETELNCLRQTIQQSLQYAYAHHILRLMVTGNFATLIGVRPAEINAWYLGIYADALEWVQLPNTHGMSQYADGGLVATKPYISGAAYLHRMSDYCQGCRYDPRVRTGPRACPFTALYWAFLHRHQPLLGRNPRLATAYRTWEKMDEATRQALLETAENAVARVEEL